MTREVRIGSGRLKAILLVDGLLNSWDNIVGVSFQGGKGLSLDMVVLLVAEDEKKTISD